MSQASHQDLNKNFLGFNKLHPRFMAVLVPLILSLIMSAVVSLVSTLRSIGFVDGLLLLWLSAWLISWIIAFPTVLFVLPIARRIALMFVRAS